LRGEKEEEEIKEKKNNNQMTPVAFPPNKKQ